ncbi:hypothetical protein N7540_010722 [Penicillium herquei]|nr:hypothetical protein N7540_010722 [Penicillium herquei]
MRFGYIIALFVATVVAVPHKVRFPITSEINMGNDLTELQNHRDMNDAMTTSMSMSMPMKKTATPTAEATPTSMNADSSMRAEKLMMP